MKECILWEPGLGGTTVGSPIRIETGRSGVSGEINLGHLFIKRCRGKREGAKGNSNLHRAGGLGFLLESLGFLFSCRPSLMRFGLIKRVGHRPLTRRLA